MKRISAICILGVLIVCFFFAVGCTMRLNKIYGYKQTKIKFVWGEVGAKLIGSYKSTKKETIKSSPYELFIWFESNSKVDGSVMITTVELHDIDEKIVVLKLDDVLKRKLKANSDGVYSAYFSFNGLNLDYVRYMLVLKFRVTTEKSDAEKKIQLYFDKDYKEYRSNDLWDRIMSV